MDWVELSPMMIPFFLYHFDINSLNAHYV